MIFGRDLQFMMPSLLSQLKVISQQTKSLCRSHFHPIYPAQSYNLIMEEKKDTSVHFLLFTFPNCVNPLCCGMAPGLSALEQSAL